MKKYTIIVLSFFLFISTSLHAKKIKYWTSPTLKIENPFDEFYVLGFNQSPIEDSILQKWVKAELSENFNIVKGNVSVVADSNYNYESKIQPIRSVPVDAILTYSIVPHTPKRFEKEPKIYSPTLQTPSYNSLWGYYTAQLKRNNISEESASYFIEMNIYEQGTLQLLWSAKSSIFSSQNLFTTSKSYLEKMIQIGIKSEIINNDRK